MKYLFTMYIKIQPILNRFKGISPDSRSNMKINKNMTCMFVGMHECMYAYNF